MMKSRVITFYGVLRFVFLHRFRNSTPKTTTALRLWRFSSFKRITFSSSLLSSVKLDKFMSPSFGNPNHSSELVNKEQSPQSDVRTQRYSTVFVSIPFFLLIALNNEWLCVWKRRHSECSENLPEISL